MRELIMWTVLSVLMSGCAAAQLSKKPDVFVLVPRKETVPAGMETSMGDRESEKAGKIQAVSVEVKGDDLANLVGDYLIKYLNEKVGLNVKRLPNGETDSVKLAAIKNKIDGVIILKTKALKVFSLNALLQPVGADLTLELIVFDQAGGEIYRRTVTGHYEKRFGITVIEKSAGELVEFVVKDALSQFVKDPELKRIIARFKYGAIAGTMAKVF